MGSQYITRDKKDNLLYCSKMHVGRSKYFVIATMILVGTIILPTNYVQAEDPPSLLVKVTAKTWKNTTVVKIENSKENIYSIKLIWLTLQNGVIESFKSANGWSADTASNPNTVQFRAEKDPLKPGESVTFGIKSDQKNPIFKWLILDEDGDELGSGILDVAKSEAKEEKPADSGSNGKSQEIPKEEKPATDGEKPSTPKVPTVPPDIQISPEVAKPGRVVRIIGEGFTPNSKLTVLFDGKPVIRLNIGADGTLKGRVLIPKDTVAGAHQISVSDTAGRAANLPVTVKIDEKRVELIVKTEQQSYRQGELVKITGTGKAGAAVQLTVNNPTGIAILSSAVPVDKEGKYSAFVPLSEDATPGDYEIIVFQEARSVKTAFKVLTISGFQMSVVTDKFEYKQGENVKISGKAAPNKEVSVRVLAPDGSEVFNNVVKTDSSGSYEVVMPVSPQSVLGKYSVVIKVESEEITITFTIAQGSVKLTIQTDREDYREGELVRISGKGKANDKVSIIIKTPKEELIKMSTNTKTDGSYSALWLVPSSAKSGIYRLFAEQGDARAEAVFVISI
jgi:5-hydroxyisourate hydrolase-like protein (transthyretin family)